MADILTQGAFQAQPRVGKIAEHPEHAVLQAGSDSATTDAGQIAYRALADLLLALVARTGMEVGVKLHRRPVEQTQIADLAVEPSSDFAEAKRSGQRLQDEVVVDDIGDRKSTRLNSSN